MNSSFTSNQVLYTRGDEEELNLKKEQWEIVSNNLIGESVCSLSTFGFLVIILSAFKCSLIILVL